jgi:hypothetical protein
VLAQRELLVGEPIALQGPISSAMVRSRSSAIGLATRVTPVG